MHENTHSRRGNSKWREKYSAAVCGILLFSLAVKIVVYGASGCAVLDRTKIQEQVNTWYFVCSGEFQQPKLSRTSRRIRDRDLQRRHEAYGGTMAKTQT